MMDIEHYRCIVVLQIHFSITDALLMHIININTQIIADILLDTKLIIACIYYIYIYKIYRNTVLGTCVMMHSPLHTFNIQHLTRVNKQH